jgi:hypothetical protein
MQDLVLLHKSDHNGNIDSRQEGKSKANNIARLEIRCDKKVRNIA